MAVLAFAASIDTTPPRLINLSAFNEITPPFLPTPLRDSAIPPEFTSEYINDSNQNHVPDAVERYIWQNLSRSPMVTKEHYDGVIELASRFYLYNECRTTHNSMYELTIEQAIAAPYVLRDFGFFTYRALPVNRLISAIISSDEYKFAELERLDIDESAPLFPCPIPE